MSFQPSVCACTLVSQATNVSCLTLSVGCCCSGRCRTMQDNPTRNVKPRISSPEGQSDRDAAAGLAALRSAAASHDDSDPEAEGED